MVSKALLVAGVFALFAFSGAAGAAEPSSGQVLHIRGSITAMPVVRSMAEAFMKRNKGSIVTVEGGPSVLGTKALLDGAVDLAMISHIVTNAEMAQAAKQGKQMLVYKFAFDTVGLLVHPSNPLDTLTLDQVRDIFTGRVTSWNDLAGADEPISIFVHGALSGTQETWQNMVMGREKVTTHAKTMTSAEVQENLAREPWAIAYLAREQIDGRFKQLALETVSVIDGNTEHVPATIRRELALVAFEPVPPSARAFLDFVRMADGGQALIAAHDMRSTEAQP